MSLVMLAGQSNALGFGNTGPAPYTPTYQVQMWVDSNADGIGDTFNFMNPGVNTGTPANPTAWGSEVEIANDWLQLHAGDNQILYFGKSVKGETPLAQSAGVDWSPASAGEMFDRAERVAHDMKANLGVDHLDAVFWMQGETDATNAAWAADYSDNLTAFLAAARARWIGDATGYVGFGRISDSAALPYNEAVRVAQWQVDQVDAHAESFKTIGFGMQADGIHYNAAGQVALGDGFFSAWVA